MTPQELAFLHPKLFHLTLPGALQGIQRHGLLSTQRLLALFEVSAAQRETLTSRRRPAAVQLDHVQHGCAILNDNLPLSEKALASCLDGGLTPADWLRVLNGKVFFWADEQGLDRLLNARMNRDRLVEVLVFDTLALAQAHWDTLRLSPINSGATIRKPARRGPDTFTLASAHTYKDWRRLRGGSDKIVEITVDEAVPRAADFLLEIRRHGPQIVAAL